MPTTGPLVVLHERHLTASAMSTSSTPHSLPAIPSLPPIQMPDKSDHDSYHSSSSVTPHDVTSPILSSPIAATRPPPLPSTHHHPQQNLRKSVSVDSFIGYERENTSTSSSSRPPRAVTHTPSDSSGARRTELSVDSTRRHVPETVPLYVRTRGISMSTKSDGQDSAVEQNLESDSWQPLKKVGDKSRKGSVKGKEQARQSRRPGDLKLPARNQSPAVPVNNMPAQIPQPTLRDDPRRLHSTTSLQSFPRHSSLTDVISGRVRSGSLGLQANPGNKSLLADAAQPMVSSQLNRWITMTKLRPCSRSPKRFPSLLWVRLVVESLRSFQKMQELMALKISLCSSRCQEAQSLHRSAVSNICIQALDSLMFLRH